MNTAQIKDAVGYLLSTCNPESTDRLNIVLVQGQIKLIPAAETKKTDKVFKSAQEGILAKGFTGQQWEDLSKRIGNWMSENIPKGRTDGTNYTR